MTIQDLNHTILKFTAIAISVIILAASQSQTAAAGTDGWMAGNIISDGIFTNQNTMDPASIQSFLNSKVPNCDTYGTQPSEFGGGTRAQWGKANYNQTTFTCLRNYNEGGKSAAQIIYDTAQKYRINPQVLIVLLQKEQGLVTDTWPLNIQYRSATGYGCPDTAACDSQYYGLTKQLDWSGKMFRAIMDNSPTWYTPYVLGNNYVRYNPNASCGGSTVNIQNRATQALYNYTPYQPNNYALNGGSSSAYPSCGAFGNRNFYTYFKSWFGDTRIAILASFAERYAELGGENGVLGKVATNQICNLTGNGCYQGFQNGGIYWSPNSGTFESYGATRTRYMQLGSERSYLGYPTSAVICGLRANGCYQGYQGGAMYYTPATGTAYENTGIMRQRYIALGTENGPLGYPVTQNICGLRANGCFQGYENGAIYRTPYGAFENRGPIRQLYLQLGTENGFLGYPVSPQNCDTKDDGCYQLYEGGTIYWTASTGAHYVRGGIFAKWGQFGREWGKLGYPTSNEIYGDAKDGAGYQTFQGGKIFWTKQGGRVILDNIGGRWNELNAEWGKLGYPVSDTICGIKDDGCFQLFPNDNVIFWSQSTGAKTVWGAIFAKWNSLGKEWSALGLPTSNETYTDGKARQTFQGGVITWDPSSGSVVSYN